MKVLLEKLINGQVSPLKYPLVTRVSLEALKNLPLTDGYFALIFSQDLITKGKGDRLLF